VNYQSNVAPIPLLCSEFGGTTDIPAIQQMAVINDQNMLSAIFWAWFNNARFNFFSSGTMASLPSGNTALDPRAMGVVQLMSEELVPPNLNEAMLAAITRVYPRITAGTPLSFGTDPDTNTFTFTYSTQLPNGNTTNSATVIVVPAGIYTNGFTATTTGGTLTQSNGSVEINFFDGTRASVTVTIEPN